MGKDSASRSCRRVIAVFLTIPAFFILVLAIVLLNARLTLLSPSFIKGIPVRQGIYSQFPQVAVNILLEDELSFGADPMDFETTIDRGPMENLIEALIPPQWLQEQVERTVDPFFDWLASDEDLPDLRIDFSQLRHGVDSDNVRDALRNLFADLPPCRPGDDFFEGNFPTCRPRTSELELIINEVIPGLEELFSEESSHGESTESTDDFSSSLQLMYQIFVWALIGSWLAFLILITLAIGIGARGLDEVLLWVGIPVMLAGGLVWQGSALVYAAAPAQITQILAQMLPQDLASMSTFVENIFIDSARDIIGRWLIIDGFLALAGGAASIFAGFILRRLKRT